MRTLSEHIRRQSERSLTFAAELAIAREEEYTMASPAGARCPRWPARRTADTGEAWTSTEAGAAVWARGAGGVAGRGVIHLPCARVRRAKRRSP